MSARELIGLDGPGYDCVDEPEAVTDSSGKFVIEGVPEGAHLRCRAPSLHQENSIFELYRASRLPWPQDHEIKLVVTGTGAIQGQVLDSAGNPPTRLFIVELEPKDLRINNLSISHLIFTSSSAESQSRNPQCKIVTPAVFAQSIATESNANLSDK